MVLEGVVILVSILVAFLLEGWRTDRELVQDVRLELESVQTELERNLLMVEVELLTLDRQISALDALVAQIDAADAESVLVGDTLAWYVTGWNSTLNPSLGAVNALIGTGSLSRIEDPQLRLGLAGIQDVFSDVIEDEILARQIAVEQLAPLLAGAIPLDYTIGAAFYGSETADAWMHRGEVPLPTFGTVLFPTSLEIRNAIALRAAWLVSARAELAPLRARLQTLVELTESELQN